MKLVRWVQASEKTQVATRKMSKSGFSLNDKRSNFSLILEQRFKNTSSKPILIGEVSRNWVELSSLKKKKFVVLIKETNDFDEINNFFRKNYWNKIGIFVKLMRKASLRWKNCSDFKGLHSIHFSRRKLIEDRDTILELTAKIQERQNEFICMNDSGDFEDAESVRSGQSHVPSQPAFFPPHPDPGGMLSRSLGMPSRSDRPPDIWDTHGLSENVFVNPTASFSTLYMKRVQSVDFRHNGTQHHRMQWVTATSFGFEMPVRTFSQKFIRP